MAKATKKAKAPLSETAGRFDKTGDYLADPARGGVRVVPPGDVAAYVAQRDAEEAIEDADDDEGQDRPV